MGYDFNVESSHKDCLFKMTETLKQKELREAEYAAKSPSERQGESFGKMMDKMKWQAEQSIKGQPNIDVGSIIRGLQMDKSELFEKFKNSAQEAVKEGNIKMPSPEEINAGKEKMKEGIDTIKNVANGLFGMFQK